MDNAERNLRVFLTFSGGLLFALLVYGLRKLRVEPTPEVERILVVRQAEHIVESTRMGKKFRLYGCMYCGETFRTPEEAANHWLEKRGKCLPVQNAERTDSSPNPR